jgi:hypothetical protein
LFEVARSPRNSKQQSECTHFKHNKDPRSYEWKGDTAPSLGLILFRVRDTRRDWKWMKRKRGTTRFDNGTEEISRALSPPRKMLDVHDRFFGELS